MSEPASKIVRRGDWKTASVSRRDWPLREPVAQALKASFDEIVHEPVPQSLKALIQQVRDAERNAKRRK